MNTMKFRPVGKPSSKQIVLVRITQHVPKRLGDRPSSRPTRAQAVRAMARNGYVPLNY